MIFNSPWFHERILETDTERHPYFSKNATTNWFKALRFEIESVHGITPQEQFNSLRDFYRNSLSKYKGNIQLGPIFEPLYFSILYSMSLDTFSLHLGLYPWICPTAIVDWYYAIYFSARSIFASLGNDVDEDNAKSANFYVSTIRTKLPYPFDMYAQKVDCSNYHPILSCAHNIVPYDKVRNFEESRSVAQGMLLQYLNGTTKWYASRTKDNILQNHSEFSNFRKKAARELLNKQLKDKIGFLHCAFRQRVKSNYRDAIYLTYGDDPTIHTKKFVGNLSFIAKFSSLISAALIERRIGHDCIRDFKADLRYYLNGLHNSSESERYWEVID